MNINQTNLTEIFRDSTVNYADYIWSHDTDGGVERTYAEFGRICKSLSETLSRYGVGAGDKVAIFSSSTPNWSVAFFAATAFGRVAVPVLPDFSGNEAVHVLDHSESKALVVGKKQYAKFSEAYLERLNVVIDIETLEILHCNESAFYAEASTGTAASDLAAIIYTSGTTGQAKGVMLSHQNIIASRNSAWFAYPLGSGDVMLSILPLAHVMELTLGMVYPFSCGSRVAYISKPPTPSYLMKKLAQVRPTAMLSVPLIIEKVYKGSVLPTIRKSPVLSWMDRHMNGILCRIVGRKLVKTFGGRMRFFGIGGAKLDVEVEKFLHKARFPYYIGYGLTETAPLLAMCSYKDTVPGQIGRAVHGVELKLHNVDRYTGEGEIVAKGLNVMPGYYKDAERTAEAFTSDGWFRTKDVASVDVMGRYAIKGRIGNMILGANGENIYPEEIEKLVLEIPEIEDAIVISRNNRLVCLVKAADNLFDLTKVEVEAKVKDAVASFKKKIADHVNGKVNSNSRLSSVELMKVPFEKTATLKIRRFLYATEAPTC